MQAMRIVFIAPALPEGPVAEHIRLLAERHEVTVGLTEVRPAGEARIGSARVVAIEEAVQWKAQVAIATHWKGTIRLFEANAERFAFWVDSLAYQRVESGEQLVASLAYDLPVDFIAAAPWVAGALQDLRPDARIFTARGGATASERSAGSGKLRVLIDDSTVPGGDPGANALKRMKRPHTRVKRIADADVVLFLDPVDGVLDATLDAARSGVIPVVFPAGGQSDLVADMKSGIVGEPEDLLGVARSLDRLQADEALRAKLSRGAAEAAGQWPDWAGATKEFEQALKQISSRSGAKDGRWPARLMADAVALSTIHHLEAVQLRRQLNEARVGKNPLRRSVRKVKRSRKLMPLRIKGARYVPDRIKRLG
jgi:hypothetical protein